MRLYERDIKQQWDVDKVLKKKITFAYHLSSQQNLFKWSFCKSSKTGPVSFSLP